MLIANKELLDEFVQTHASAVKPLNTWVERVKEAAVVIFVGGVMNIRFVGTHAEYNKIDSATI